jgi:16S rRNA (uracil1498-N3)-methyltransferase
MRIPRIYQNQTLLTGSIVTLDEQTAHHLSRVLRFSKGYLLNVFDGKGHEFRAHIHEITKKIVSIQIDDPIQTIPESPLFIHLGQSISRSAKMDLAIQKAVELGVMEITPLITEFSQVKRNDDHLLKRTEHWQSIIINACEQCGRAQLPIFNEAVLLSDWLKPSSEDLSLLLIPTALNTLPNRAVKPKSVRLLIGPEGGLSEIEIKTALDHGFIGTKLGPRILRTETATLAAITLLQAHWGDFTEKE